MVLINVVVTSVIHQGFTVIVLFGNVRFPFPPCTLYDDREEEDEDDKSSRSGGNDHPGLVRQIPLHTFICGQGVLVHVIFLATAKPRVAHAISFYLTLPIVSAIVARAHEFESAVTEGIVGRMTFKSFVFQTFLSTDIGITHRQVFHIISLHLDVTGDGIVDSKLNG